MGLKILKYRDGTTRPTWWARYCTKGKYHDCDLRVPIAGTIPRDENGKIALTVKGDADFEKSRRAALRELAKLDKVRQEHTDKMRENVHHARTGESIDGTPLSHLHKMWLKKKRGYAPTQNSNNRAKAWFANFSVFADKYARKRNAVCETVNDITPEIAGAWFADIKGKYTWETVKMMMGLMRNAYQAHATTGHRNPFADIVVRNRETANARVSHKPLTKSELNKLFDAAAGDADTYGLIVAAACTGMRIGDVCKLNWGSIDLKNGLIDVVTTKAGVPVTIPIFGRLRDVLAERGTIPHDGTTATEYVFPRAAETYARDASAISKLIKPYIAKALFSDPEPTAVDVKADGKATATHELGDVIDAAGFMDHKRTRILEVYARIKAGEKSKDIAAAMGITKQTVCDDLMTAERLTGEKLRPMASAINARAERIALIDRTKTKRGIGRYFASVYGWHSLRHTFVVMALDAGVPLADVEKVVGHSSCEMTLDYYNPEKRHAAERVRTQMAGGVLDGNGNTQHARGKAIATTAPVPVTPSVDDIIAALSDADKKALAKKLLGL